MVRIFGQVGRYWIRYATAFEADCTAASLAHDRFQDVWSGLRQRIALAPEDGKDSRRGDGSLIIGIAPHPAHDLPGLVVLCGYDDTTITMLRLRLTL